MSAVSSAAPAALWALLADPVRWPDWAPHIRRADGRRGAVVVGDEVVVRGHGPVAVRTRITRVDPGRRWDFTVTSLPGPWSVNAAHAVVAAGTGARIVVGLRVRGPGAPLLGATALDAYRPLAGLAVRRLARLAEQDT